jgi:hypothetical protein
MSWTHAAPTEAFLLWLPIPSFPPRLLLPIPDIRNRAPFGKGYIRNCGLMHLTSSYPINV